MKRKSIPLLKQWANSTDHKPLIIRGARQVGKTHLVKEFAEDSIKTGIFTSFIAINFEEEPKYQACFETFNPQEILDGLSFLTHQAIEPGKSLLFLDEIQACPKALTALRYFREKMPTLHIIATGSLLEFVLEHEEISMPVGRVQYLYLYPCTFDEYLEASQPKNFLKLQEYSLVTPPSSVIHEALLAEFKKFMIVGGMPEALNHYLTHQELHQVQLIQNSILQTYRDDFGKYATRAEHASLQMLYDKAPGLVGTQISYSKIDPDTRSRELKRAIQLLEYAGLVKRILSTSATGLPLARTVNEKKFKLHFLDIGLTQRASGLSAELLLQQGHQKLNDGPLAEQVVGQLLLANQDPYVAGPLYFWARDKVGSQAEVDFVLNIEGNIIPVEVKSSRSGRLKSMQIFLSERQLPLGIKISTAPLSYENNILNVPFYLISQLERLVKTSPQAT